MGLLVFTSVLFLFQMKFNVVGNHTILILCSLICKWHIQVDILFNYLLFVILNLLTFTKFVQKHFVGILLDRFWFFI